MPATLFSPRQVAQALGVSESSVKRWVDSGKLKAAKTAGGHRKVPLPSVAAFIRSTGHPVAQPHLIGMVATTRETPLEAAQDDLLNTLMAGNEDACRELVLGFYQRGDTIAAIGDALVGPVFRRVGDGWERGAVQVHEERRCCEVMMATLHELRRWLATPAPTAPLALVATPRNDYAEVPVRLVELTLIENGWRVVPAGSGLPMSEVAAAVFAHAPRLVCVSATHVGDTPQFIASYNQDLVATTRARRAADGLSHALGGGALCGEDRAAANADLVAESLVDLAAYQATLRDAG